jgi:hypothetical protein
MIKDDEWVKDFDGSNDTSHNIIFFFNGSTAPLGPGLFFSFIIIFTDGRAPRTSDQLVARPLPKHRINTYTHQTSMPCMGFEPTTSASERAKTVPALDPVATVTGI